MREIIVESRVCSSAKIEQLLEAALHEGVSLARRGGAAKRGADPSLLIALVGAGGAALGALVAGLLDIAEQARAARIILVGVNGRRVEVPATVSPAELDLFIAKAAELDVERVVLDRAQD
ncbi:hypothetical protein LB518_21945 [Mesorhizobium sp. BR1-1-16]|uniref:hypothetical protein n=1 Tax=Mesorhizobium sp. BR1-1-16 TaxID=2876653 RepID=UPI001CCAB46E|nr:hypothetical protein [Mesorhizobium sp. BR1-1-16]MBZ9938975.1 hypothetical protein [Mesorhizobium sp. BR1-1-16]